MRERERKREAEKPRGRIEVYDEILENKLFLYKYYVVH